jgi:hypothetical protein
MVQFGADTCERPKENLGSARRSAQRVIPPASCLLSPVTSLLA